MKRARLALAAALSAAAWTACRAREAPLPGGGTGDVAVGVATDHVDLPRSYLFAPQAITVRAGTRVTWTNHDAFTHGVQFADGDRTSLVLKPGDSASMVLSVPGLHRYVCPFHEQMMRGMVVVTPN